jgi:outer membrane receptor protein involved in Fe transport
MLRYPVSHTSFLLGALALLGSSGVNTPLRAQRNMAADARAINEPRVTIHADRVRLSDALRLIGAQAKVRIGYSPLLVPADRIVTIHAENVAVSEAVRRALAGTDVRISRTEDGSLLLFRTTDTVANEGIVQGRVLDAATQRPIRGVAVSLDRATTGVDTDESGRYRLAGVPAGTHVVVFKRIGYTRITRQITVAEAPVTVDVALSMSVNTLDQVVVTGTVVPTELKAVPNAITVITAKQIEERGITRIDQLFRGDVPGLFALNRGSSAPLDEVIMYSRGATALTSVSLGTTFQTNPIKTYIDGVEMANPRYLSQIDPKSIERIEILTGPQASTIYGSNAINGVMQIFTKRGATSRPQLIVGLTSGFAQNNFSNAVAPSHLADARLSGLEGRWSYSVGSSWEYIGAWTPAKQTQRVDVNGGGRVDLGVITADVSGRWGNTRNKQGSSSNAQGLITWRATGLVTSPELDVPRPSVSTLTGRTVGVSLGYRPFSWWSHDVNVGRDVSETDYTLTARIYDVPSDTVLNLNGTRSSRQSERYSTTLQVPLLSRSRLNLTLGGDHWRTTGMTWGASALVLTGSFFNTSVVRTHPDKNTGAFAQGQLGIGDALFFTYGIRADWNPSFGDNADVRPGRYGVSYVRDIGPVSAKLRGSYGRSTRPPFPNLKKSIPQKDPFMLEYWAPYDIQLANAELGPEYQQGGEGGLDLYMGGRASLSITRYNQTVDALISSVQRADSVPTLLTLAELGEDPANFPQWPSGYLYEYQSQYLNVGSIRNQGWELQGSVTTGPVTTRGTYSWTKSRVLGITPRYRERLQSTNPDLTPGRPFDYIPEHTWALGVTYAHAATSVTLSTNGTGLSYRANQLLSLGASPQARLKTDLLRVGLPTGFRQIGRGYTMTDLNASHRFTSHIDALLQMNNVADAYHNDISPQLATMGRQTKVGVRIRTN